MYWLLALAVVATCNCFTIRENVYIEQQPVLDNTVVRDYTEKLTKIGCASLCSNTDGCNGFHYCIDINDVAKCSLMEMLVVQVPSASCTVYAEAAFLIQLSTPIPCQDDWSNPFAGENCDIRLQDCKDVGVYKSSTPGLFNVLPEPFTTSFTVQCQDFTDNRIPIMFRHASQPGCLETPVTYLDVPRKHYKSDLISDPCYMWLGLDRIHALTLVRPYSLLIQFNTTSGLWGEALYNDFSVGDESSGYSLSIYGFTGKGVAGDAFKTTMLHETLNGAAFCAKDTCPEAMNQCAADNKGAWWSREDTECAGTPHNGNNILCPQAESLTPCLDYVMWLIPNEIPCCF